MFISRLFSFNKFVSIGEAGDVADQEENAKIIKLVIAGNSLSSETRDKKVLSTAKYLTSGQEASSGI